ncbi:hypothetical protein GVN20_16775 [Runella sp. CRIBMP]|uniref:M56 family metallopeptidase n=1 Tax=Runella sp. CRIBMP TaxID=2683261 RepID=UPI0014131896|nr:M56 family metallopeptidase [Runella sp. CRIBMP]NBB21023.1 hypothetical protein [Runella sp. CRIBMP]
MNYELLSYLLKASLVLAILTTAYAWLVKRETFLQVNRWLLWINVAATLLLPIIPLPDLEWVPNAPAQAVAVVLPPKPASPVPKVTKSEPFIAPSPQATTVPSAVLEDSSLSVWDWIGIVYGVVAGLLVLKLLIQLGALWRLQHGSTQYETEDGVYLIENDKITSPFSFFNRIFYNPTHHNDDEWAQVWAHECVHAHQLHSIDMLTAEVLKIVFWFNPFAWWHQRLVQETLEFITDRAVLDSGIEKKSYQYHLLRTTLSADKQTFTNHFGVPHFNKSLLKTRIEMMNKSKSKWMGVGKYFLFVAMLWVCAAFTKPYRAEIAAKIVKEVPELKVVFERQNPPLTQLNDFVLEAPPKPEKETVVSVNSSSKDTLVSQTKYVIYKDNKLHWVVTPTMTFEDFLAIHEEFEKVGATFYVKKTDYDPISHYLSGIHLKTSFLKDGEDCYTNVSGAKQEPITAFGGWVAIEGGRAEINKTSFDHQFSSVVSADKEKVDKWLASHSREYRKAELEAESRKIELELRNYESQWRGSTNKFYSSPLKTPNGIAKFSPNALQYLCQMGARNRIYFEERQLRIENLYKSSEFFINNQPSTYQEAEKLIIDEIRYVVSYAFYTDSTRKSAHRTMIIFTKESNKP